MVAIVGDVVTLLGICVVMFVINWKLALITLSVIPVLLVVTFIFRKHVRDLYRQTRQKIARLNSYLHENLVGMRVVQLFNREPKNFAEFDAIGDDLKQTYLRTVFYYAVFFPGVELISAVAVALIIFGGGGLMLTGAVTLGTLVAFLQYVERFYRPVRDLAEKYNILQGAMAAAERVFKVIDEPIEVAAAASSPCCPRPRWNPPRQTAQTATANWRTAAWPSSSAMSGSPTTTRSGCCATSASASRPANPSPSSATPAPARPPSSRCSAASTTCSAGRFWSTASMSANTICRRCAACWASCCRTSSCLRAPSKTISAMAVPRPSRAEVERAAELVHADRFIRRLPQGFDEPVMERGATLSAGERQLLGLCARAALPAAGADSR